jgi:hypothetical protein
MTSYITRETKIFAIVFTPVIFVFIVIVIVISDVVAIGEATAFRESFPLV